MFSDGEMKLFENSESVKPLRHNMIPIGSCNANHLFQIRTSKRVREFLFRLIRLSVNHLMRLHESFVSDQDFGVALPVI